MTRLVWADAETSGIRPDRGAEIWELALIIRDTEDLTGDHEVRKLHDAEYVWQIRPELSYAGDAMALRVGGYYQRCEVRDCEPGHGRLLTGPGRESSGGELDILPARAIAAAIAGLLDGAHLIATNPHFDAGHLDALLEKHGEALCCDYHYTDIGSLVRGWRAGRCEAGDDYEPVPWPLKLTKAAMLAGLDITGYDLHSALGDARLARDITDRVTGGAL